MSIFFELVVLSFGSGRARAEGNVTTMFLPDSDIVIHSFCTYAAFILFYVSAGVKENLLSKSREKPCDVYRSGPDMSVNTQF